MARFAIMLLALTMSAPAFAQQSWIGDPPAAAHFDQSTDLGNAMAICNRFFEVRGPAPNHQFVGSYDAAHFANCDAIRAQWQKSDDAAKQKAAADKAAADEQFLNGYAKGLTK